MSVSDHISGSEASLRPAGIARFVGAAFLSVWLAGWVVGESFAIGFLVMLFRAVLGAAAGMNLPPPGAEWAAGGAAAFAIVFLLVWLTLWTFGGLAAITELLRSLAGEDLISVMPSGLTLVRRAGPFRRTYTFDRAAVRRIRFRKQNREIVIDTSTGTKVLTKFGTPGDREAIMAWLQRHMSLPADSDRLDANTTPPGWSATSNEGTTRLSRGEKKALRIAAIIAWTVVFVIGIAWYGSLNTGNGSTSALVITLVLAAGAAWLTWARHEWIVRAGQLTEYRAFATWDAERRFVGARLEVEASRDSDGDDRYRLIVSDGSGKRTIAAAIHDDADVVALGRWMSARTGFPLTLPGSPSRGLKPSRYA
jgi:hypothetical protein